MLRTKRDSPQSRAAYLIDAPCRAFDRQTRVDMGLTCRVLSLRRGENLAQDRFRNFRLFDTCARNDSFQHGRAKIMCRRIGECASKRADGCSSRGCDNNVSHVSPPPEFFMAEACRNVVSGVARYPPPADLVITH